MDSLTQVVLGASVAGAIAGRKYGRKAVLAGAICGTLPDLDVLIDHGDAMANMIEHRGFSHSLLVLTIIAPFITWLFSKIRWFEFDVRDKRLHLAIWLALFTHPLLDAMTIYGTQLLWPFTDYPFGVGSVFIIDPLYTIPLIIGLAAYLIGRWHRILIGAIAFTSLYLAWSVAAQFHVTMLAKQSLGVQPYNQALSLPTPFNTVLWRVLVMNDDGYQVGYYSLLDDNTDIEFINYRDESDLPESTDVQKFMSFTKGYIGVIEDEEQVIVQDLRMGLEPDNYVFQYIIGAQNNGRLTAVPNERYRVPRDIEGRLSQIWRRIFDEGEGMQ